MLFYNYVNYFHGCKVKSTNKDMFKEVSPYEPCSCLLQVTIFNFIGYPSIIWLYITNIWIYNYNYISWSLQIFIFLNYIFKYLHIIWLHILDIFLYLASLTSQYVLEITPWQHSEILFIPFTWVAANCDWVLGLLMCQVLCTNNPI